MENWSIAKVVEIAELAGKEILKVYARRDFEVESKVDESPLTLADRLSHDVIESELTKLSNIPILSEEGKNVPYSERKQWRELWIVDPLDGTKEFVKRNGEFTVNIALIRDGVPVAGVVHLPVLKTTYYAFENESWKHEYGAKPERLDLGEKDRIVNAVRSRSHLSPEEEELYKRLSIQKVLPFGSALKLTMIAEGAADIYYRHGPTMEWDIAAGQAVIEAAGGSVIDLQNRPIRYNRENMVNPSFIALGRVPFSL